MSTHQLFRKDFWLGFGVKQIIDFLSFLLLLTNTGLNFNKKMSLNNTVNQKNSSLTFFFVV